MCSGSSGQVKSIAAAQQDLSAIAARLAKRYPETNAGYGVRILDFYAEPAGGMKLVLLIMLGAVGLVLLIACGNLATISSWHEPQDASARSPSDWRLAPGVPR